MDIELQDKLLECHKYGEFILPDGTTDDDYYDVLSLLLDWEGLSLVGHEILDLLRAKGYSTLTRARNIDAYACLALAPVTLAATLAGASLKKCLIVRKQRKGYGTNKLIEGNPMVGDNVLIVEDVTSTGSSVLKAIKALKEVGCKIFGIVTIINRQEGCDELLKDYNFWWLTTKAELDAIDKERTPDVPF